MTNCKCGRPTETGYKTCRPCIDKSLKYARAHPEVAARSSSKRAKRFRSLGLCHCGNETSKGMKTCSRCQTRTREFARQRVESYKAKGLCTYCGERPSLEGIKLCLRCKLVAVERVSRTRFRAPSVGVEQVMSLWDKQRGRCAITGVVMEFTGMSPTSVSLDHIQTGLHVAENLQWVCWRVNQMKGDMYLEDFLHVLGPDGVSRLAQVLVRGRQSTG